MEEKRDEQIKAGVNRRAFIGALGAAAVAGALAPAAEAQSPPPTPYFLDSFGNVQPCAADTIAAGVLPPPIAGLPTPNPGTPGYRKRRWLFGRRSQGPKHHAAMAPRDLSGCLNTSCYGFSTTPSPGYPMYNILMIIVDQMRAPRWIPTNTPLGSGLPGQEALDAIMPSIASIRKQSYVFANYNVAATDCSPCRATLLTGLYSQQTCIFATQDGPTNPNLPFPPSLQPWNQMVGGVLTPGQGFPTIGDVLSQSNPALNYDCVWIGKWHLSDNPQESESQYVCNPGRKGPSDYGFQDAWCIPTPPTGGSYPWPYPSPSGLSSHEGASGNFGNFTGNTTVGDPVGSNDVPYYNANTDTPPYAPGLTPPSYNQLNDAATASAFATWINSHAPTANKWFAAVSFINPHDITQFPYSFDLTQGSPCTAPTGDFCSPLPSIRTRPGSSHR